MSVTTEAVLIGVDVGATTISGGLVTLGGETLSVVQVPTRRDGPGAAPEILLGVITDLVGQAAARGLALEGIGVGVPGLVDGRRGLMTGSSDLVPELAHIPLVERVEAKTGTRTFVDNDANALALGEWMFGLARGAGSAVLLALGSGVGGAVILDGRLLRGKDGYAGEFGHVPINFDGPPCMCGGRGCLCGYLSGSFLAWQAQDHVTRQPDSKLLELAGGNRLAITTEMIFEAAAAGDPLAGRMVGEACQALGAGLGVIVNALNPEVIVVIGGVVRSLARLEPEIRRCAAEYALEDAFRTTRIHLVPGDKQHTVRGGAALVLYEQAHRRGVRGGPRGARRKASHAKVRRET